MENDMVYISLDILFTGDDLEDPENACFGIGYCVGSSKTNILENGKWIAHAAEEKRYDSQSEEDWWEVWKLHGWDHTKIDDLDGVMLDRNTKDERELFGKLDALLMRYRDVYGCVIIEKNGLKYNWLNKGLSRYGFKKLIYDRDGDEEVDVICLQSFLLGASGKSFYDFDDFNGCENYFDCELDKRARSIFTAFMDVMSTRE